VTRGRARLLIAAAALVLLAAARPAHADDDPAAEPESSVLPFLGDEARKRGIELPNPFGIGGVYYHLDRAIQVSDLRLGRNGAPPVSVSQFAQLSSDSRVDNVNAKFDVWLLPFLNVYAIAGYVWNESQTSVVATLPPLLPGGAPRVREVSLPTSITGTIGGLGITLAGGYGPFLFAADVNGARADLGFSDKFQAVVTSLRAGWHGKARGRPIRAWLSGTYWNTFAEAKDTVADPDGGTLTFEVDQGPEHPWTYGAGMSYAATRSFDFAVDMGTDFHGGWYVAIVPAFRF
jgi:hypothetical protein